jgi:hypothetical protein
MGLEIETPDFPESFSNAMIGFEESVMFISPNKAVYTKLLGTQMSAH